MADILADDKPKIVNVKFRDDEERDLHAKFKSQCALRGEGMQDRIIVLIKQDVGE